MRSEFLLSEDIIEILKYFSSFTGSEWLIHLSGTPRQFDTRCITTIESEYCREQLSKRNIPVELEIGIEYNRIGVNLDFAIQYYQGVNPNEKTAIRSGIL